MENLGHGLKAFPYSLFSKISKVKPKIQSGAGLCHGALSGGYKKVRAMRATRPVKTQMPEQSPSFFIA
jgi:hypothetical protein